MQIAQELLEQVLDHARRDAPNECCGFVALEDGRAVEVIATDNVAASPFRFEVDSRDLLRITMALEDAGRDIVIYHSHTRSEPYPSQTDVTFAQHWPGVQWLIVGVDKAGEVTKVRNFRIDGAEVSETEVEVDAG